MSDNATFPGDKIASIEEYEAGYNTFDDGDMVRAATVGQKDINKTTRTVSINHPKMLKLNLFLDLSCQSIIRFH